MTALMTLGLVDHLKSSAVTYSILHWYECGKEGICVSTDAANALNRYSQVALVLEDDGFLHYAPKRARKDELVLARKGPASSRKGLRRYTFRLKGRANSETTVTAKSLEQAVKKAASCPHYYELGGKDIPIHEMERLAPGIDFSN